MSTLLEYPLESYTSVNGTTVFAVMPTGQKITIATFPLHPMSDFPTDTETLAKIFMKAAKLVADADAAVKAVGKALEARYSFGYRSEDKEP